MRDLRKVRVFDWELGIKLGAYLGIFSLDNVSFIDSLSSHIEYKDFLSLFVSAFGTWIKTWNIIQIYCENMKETVIYKSHP